MQNAALARVQDRALNFVHRISDSFAAISERLHFMDGNAWARTAHILLWFALPLTLVILALPEAAPLRDAIDRVIGRTAGSYLHNDVWGLVGALAGLYLAICINRGWGRAEAEREAMVVYANDSQKILPPDLRGSALFAGVMALLLISAIAYFANDMACRLPGVGCLYTGPRSQSTSWLAASADIAFETITFSIPKDVFSYGSLSGIAPQGVYGRSLELLLRLLVEVLFVASIFELYRIRRTIVQAVENLRTLAKVDTKPLKGASLRLGSRLVPELCNRLRSTLDDNSQEATDSGDVDPNRFAHNAANALGQLEDVRAIPTLKHVASTYFKTNWPQHRAIKALSDIAKAIQTNSAHGLTLPFAGRMVLLRLRIWCAYRRWREGRRAQKQGNPDNRVVKILDALTEQLRSGGAPAAVT